MFRNNRNDNPFGGPLSAEDIVDIIFYGGSALALLACCCFAACRRRNNQNAGQPQAQVPLLQVAVNDDPVTPVERLAPTRNPGRR